MQREANKSSRKMKSQSGCLVSVQWCHQQVPHQHLPGPQLFRHCHQPLIHQQLRRNLAWSVEISRSSWALPSFAMFSFGPDLTASGAVASEGRSSWKDGCVAFASEGRSSGGPISERVLVEACCIIATALHASTVPALSTSGFGALPTLGKSPQTC